MIKWTKRFLELAKLISTWSKDPSSKVGAVIVDENRRIVSTGYNGFPIKINDSIDRLENRETKLRMTNHAELNALLFAQRDLSNCIIYITAHPCSRCAAAIIQSGIKKVICKKISNKFYERWADEIKDAKTMFKEADVIILEVD